MGRSSGTGRSVSRSRTARTSRWREESIISASTPAISSTSALWALREFGHARLGNKFRTRRLVTLAAKAADHPNGLITEIIDAGSERDAAYRFIENDAIRVDDICQAARIACIRRCMGEPFVYVPMDPSSLHIRDPRGTKKTGRVGNLLKHGRGCHMVNAIAVRKDGTPLGLAHQEYWTRGNQRVPKDNGKRKIGEKETRHWLKTMEIVASDFKVHAPGVQPWFQLDRGGDFKEMLSIVGSSTDILITVRATHNRRVADSELRYLWDQLENQPVLGHYNLEVPKRPGRHARTANMRVTSVKTTLLLRDRWTKKYSQTTLWAILAREEGTTPENEDPIRWLLFTNHPAGTFDDAQAVVRGYGYRWRIEDFHKTWKSTCRVEATQMRHVLRIEIWATILACIAMRIERLKHLARNSPDLPASVELSQEEIDAVIVLKRPKGFRRGEDPPIGLMTRWIADLGSYSGKKPPGAIVIGRGLAKVDVAVQAIASLDAEKLRIS